MREDITWDSSVPGVAPTTWRDYFKVFIGVIAAAGAVVALLPAVWDRTQPGSIADRVFGVPEYAEAQAAALITTGLGVAVVAGLASLTLHIWSVRLRSGAEKAISAEKERLAAARARFLDARGIALNDDETRQLWSKLGGAPSGEDRDEAVFKGTVDGAITEMSLQWKNGELVVADAEGRELRPPVAA